MLLALSGDVGKVTIGSHSQIKDKAVLSASSVIGDFVIVGSGALIGEGVKVCPQSKYPPQTLTPSHPSPTHVASPLQAPSLTH